VNNSATDICGPSRAVPVCGKSRQKQAEIVRNVVIRPESVAE
jgi:hypothetical protein